MGPDTIDAARTIFVHGNERGLMEGFRQPTNAPVSPFPTSVENNRVIRRAISPFDRWVVIGERRGCEARLTVIWKWKGTRVTLRAEL